jgi:hypothetical protein
LVEIQFACGLICPLEINISACVILNGLAIVEYNSVMVVQNSKFGLGLGAAE